MPNKIIRLLFSSLFVLIFSGAHAQIHARFADSLMIQYEVPELAYAVISSDSVLEMSVGGITKIHTDRHACLNDRFRIGSNTKTITTFIAAELVKKGLINWNSRLIDVCPDLKQYCKSDYVDLTLLQLLSFRSKLLSWTYTNAAPPSISNNVPEEEQRYQFIRWALQQPPAANNKGFSFSNPGYVVAGLMLERVSGKLYKDLVADLGKRLDISFGFGAPNLSDSLQPWGHNADLIPEPPTENPKLNWLLPAGNVNVSLPDYIKYIQLHLKGLRGQSNLLSRKEFEFLHYGLPEFALGWFWNETKGHKLSNHTGNPGTFLSEVVIDSDNNRAYILFANAQTENTIEAFDVLLTALMK